ncbi:20195_t:CDS:2, partial [Racocetra fulgida]
DTDEEATYLLRAGNNVDAHKIVISKIAPESILHKRHKKLQELLERIDPNFVPDWDLDIENNPTYRTDLMGICQSILSGLAKMKPIDLQYKKCITYMI